MKYFVPDIRVADEVGDWFFAEKPIITERLGGRPWGLLPDRWPKCRQCGKSQSLLAQFSHDDQRLNLRRTGRVLFVFQCAHKPGLCDSWEASSGANACFIAEPEDLTNAETALPTDSPPLDEAVLIAGWVEREDPVPAHLADKFLSDAGLWSIEEDICESVSDGTRLGSVPCWIQSADEAPSPGWRFVGQLESLYRFLTPPKRSYRWVSKDRSGHYFAQGPNLGDAGIAYLFVRDGENVPEACMFWQCS